MRHGCRVSFLGHGCSEHGHRVMLLLWVETLFVVIVCFLETFPPYVQICKACIKCEYRISWEPPVPFIIFEMQSVQECILLRLLTDISSAHHYVVSLIIVLTVFRFALYAIKQIQVWQQGKKKGINLCGLLCHVALIYQKRQICGMFPRPQQLSWPRKALARSSKRCSQTEAWRWLSLSSWHREE